MRGASISLLFIILLAAISDAHSTNKFGQSPSSSESEPQFKAPAGATGPRPSENVLGKEPWCGPLVRGLTTTIAEGKHIRFCWRDDPAAVMRPLQVDTESINRVTEVLTQLNMQPKPFSSHGLGHINVRIFPPSREMEDGGMFTARVPVYPDDDLDTLADEVQEEYLLPPASMRTLRCLPAPWLLPSHPCFSSLLALGLIAINYYFLVVFWCLFPLPLSSLP